MFFDLFDHDISHQFYRYLREFLSKGEIDRFKKDSETAKKVIVEHLAQPSIENKKESVVSEILANKQEHLQSTEEKLKQQQEIERLIEEQYGTPKERKKIRKERENHTQPKNYNSKSSTIPTSRFDKYVIIIPVAIVGLVVFKMGKVGGLW